jgi:Fungal chitosanase of glycosyl hydrolase group 75
MATLLKTIGGVKIYQEANALLYLAGMQIDADGDEMAYGPDGVPGIKPLDYLANAGKPGNWWGITTDSAGQPYVQQPYHRGPGYYVSSTALENPAFPESNPDRYLDSSQIPFFVLPSDFHSGMPSPLTPPKLGDLGFAYNTETKDNNAMVYGDIGPKAQIGEASIAAAKSLGVNSDPKTGGTSKPVICYWFVPGSGKGWQPVDVWWNQALNLFNTWGGLKRLTSVIASL